MLKVISRLRSCSVRATQSARCITNKPGVPPFQPPDPLHRNPDLGDSPADSPELDPRRPPDVLPGEEPTPVRDEPLYRNPNEVPAPSQFPPGRDIPEPNPGRNPFPSNDRWS